MRVSRHQTALTAGDGPGGGDPDDQ